jgi:hypothetical protein
MLAVVSRSRDGPRWALGPASSGGVPLLGGVLLEESSHLIPRVIPVPEKKVASRRELDQSRVRNETRGVSGIGQYLVKVIGSADKQCRSTDSLEWILPVGSLSVALR